MSRAINLPSQSVKLTNVAIVRLTVQGKRFEVACYKNKVLDYRNGLETDLSEVLQTPNIFTNVTKGQLAKAADCRAAFGPNQTTEQMAITILQKGKSLQVSEVERNQLYETTLTQIATHLATTCFHPATGKPYTVSQIKQALTEAPSTTVQPTKHHHADEETLHFSVQPNKPLKQQYLHALKYLQQQRNLPIVRAAMELDWYYDRDDAAPQVDAILQELQIHHSSTDAAATSPRRLLVDPSLYRPLQEMATQRVPGSRLEIVRQQVFETPRVNVNPVAAASTTIEETVNEEDEEEFNNEEDKVPMPRKQKKKKHLQRLQQQMESTRIADAPAPPLPQQFADHAAATVVVTEEGPRCNTCPGSAFPTAAEYRAHFRSDWHRYNLKLKLQQCAPIRYEEFQQCDAESFFTAVDTDL